LRVVKRALIIVLDSVGIGHAPDAADFGDEGSNTVGHIHDTVDGFSTPHLDQAGLRSAGLLAAGDATDHLNAPTWSWGCLTEISAGKDTTTGHWELAGAPVLQPFAVFDHFPDHLINEMEEASGTSFIGNYAESGTVILEQLGEEHLRTRSPILYTSADSVIQIAAHESVIPLKELYEICKACRKIADRERIGRVIARPFEGEVGGFKRTNNRHDFSLEPPRTVLNELTEAGIETVGVGKISDIFNGSGIQKSYPTASNAEGAETILNLLDRIPNSPELIFANLVDLDMLYGHRRDPVGYAAALEAFDEWLPELESRLSDDLLVIITADHGNDPTWTGTDHTREKVPLLVRKPGPASALGCRDSFSDVAATIAEWFSVSKSEVPGNSFC
jgi:phosphopentomutase